MLTLIIIIWTHEYIVEFYDFDDLLPTGPPMSDQDQNRSRSKPSSIDS